MKPALWDFAPERVRNKEFWKRSAHAFPLWEGEGRTVWCAPDGAVLNRGETQVPWSSGSNGLRLDLSVADGHYVASTPPALQLKFPFTLLFSAQRLGAVTGQSPVLFGATYSDPGQNPWWGYAVFRNETSAVNPDYLTVGTHQFTTYLLMFGNTPGFQVEDEPVKFAVVLENFNSRVIREDQVIATSSQGLAPGYPSYTATSNFNLGQVGPNFANVGLDYVYPIDQALTLDEIRDIHARPYLQFEPERFRPELIQGEAGPPPSFVAAWAEGTTIVDGAHAT